MTWGAALKTFATSSAKKVAGSKLMGRRGSTANRRQNAKNIMQKQGDYEGGGALAIRSTPTTSLVPTTVSDSALAVSSTSSGPSGQGVGGALLRIHTKTIAIDKFLKTKKKKDNKKIRTDRRVKEDDKRKKREGTLEKSKDKEKQPGGGLSLPMPSFFDSIKKFITNVILGWITLKLMEWGPKLTPILKMVGSALDGFLTIGGWLFDAMATVINIGYSAFTAVEGSIKAVFGEKGLEIFHKFTDAFKHFITVAFIAAMVSAKAGVLSNVIQGAQAFLRTPGVQALGTKIVTGAKSVASAVFSVPTAIVAGVGLLSSAIGEGGFQLVRWSRENLENPAREAADKAKDKWWTDPRRWFWEGVAGILGFLNLTSQFTFNLLDIIGTPFRYLIELIRWPFLDEAGREKQADNLAKFDARIREGFRSFFNSFDFLNIISDEEGGWGDMWGGRGAEQMEGNYGYREEEESNEEKRLGGWIPTDSTYDLHAGEIVIDGNSAIYAKDMLLAINAASTREGVIKAIRDYAPYEIGSSKPALAIPVSLTGPTMTSQENTPRVSPPLVITGNDFAETLYKG